MHFPHCAGPVPCCWALTATPSPPASQPAPPLSSSRPPPGVWQQQRQQYSRHVSQKHQKPLLPLLPLQPPGVTAAVTRTGVTMGDLRVGMTRPWGRTRAWAGLGPLQGSARGGQTLAPTRAPRRRCRRVLDAAGGGADGGGGVAGGGGPTGTVLALHLVRWGMGRGARRGAWRQGLLSGNSSGGSTAMYWTGSRQHCLATAETPHPL